jgi:hypothetical protein
MFKHNRYTRPVPDSATVKIKMAEVEAALSNRPNVQQQGLVQLSRALANKMVASKTPNKLSHNDEVSKECKDRTKELVQCFFRDDPPLPVKRSPASLDLQFKIKKQLGASRHKTPEEPRKAKDSPSQAQQTVNVISQILQCCRKKIANHKTWFQEQVCLQLIILTSSLIFDILYLYIRPRA